MDSVKAAAEIFYTSQQVRATWMLMWAKQLHFAA